MEEAAMQDMRPRVWLRTDELAERLRTAPSTVRYWRFAGLGPRGVKIGRRVLYDLTEVERWEAEQAKDSGAAGAA
jgi:DNA-binding transcriptional regulator YiaG